jgi:eukaryotic-like serine/threonine-protein kinase
MNEAGGASADDLARALAATSAPPSAGDRIGPYRLVRFVGAGAGGRVFEVVHEVLGRAAAMKLLAATPDRPAAARARFLAEIVARSRIHDPHIVAVTDVVETDEHDALVMELLEGESLGAAIARGRLEPEQYLPVLAQVCAGLAAAHAAGLVHRDLKPENVFLCARPGRAPFVKLLDFGVATPLPTGGAASATRGGGPSRSRPGRLVGTPAYVSPEQASGDPVDHTTDLYAVGVMLYELAVGRLPFEGWNVGQFLIQHVSAPVPHLPASVRATPLGRALDELVQRCMAKRPAERIRSAAELAATFTALARGETPAGKTVVPRLTAQWPSRQVLAVGVASGLLALAVAGILGRHGERTLKLVAAGALAPTPAAFVTLAFESEPAGARVFRVRDGALLGVTPFHRDFPRGGEDLSVEIRREAFEPVRLSVSLSSDRTVGATLAAAHHARPKRAHGARERRIGDEKTIDPFHR